MAEQRQYVPLGEARASGGIRLRSAVRLGSELLLTAGAVLLLYVVWQLWWTNFDARARQQGIVGSLSAEFGSPAKAADPDRDYGPPAIGLRPEYGQPFGIVYIPRFGPDYSVPLSAGVGSDVLDSLGLGAYPGGAMPGQVGNFAVAGHRQTHGKVLDLVHTLVPGDRIYVRTAEGYYTYVFRDSEVVTPDRTDVLLPVPKQPAARPTEQLMTLTTCHPRFGDQERLIGYAVMDSWQPSAAGPPAEIAGLVTDAKEG